MADGFQPKVIHGGKPDPLDYPNEGDNYTQTPQSSIQSGELKEAVRTFFTTTEGEPGRIQIAMFEGHGADERAMRRELSVGQMQDLHEKLTKALWDHMRRGDEQLRRSIFELSERLAKK